MEEVKLRTKQEWEQQYKKIKVTDGYTDFYRQVESEAMWVGRYYMEGKLSVEQVRDWLFSTGSYYPFDGYTKSANLVSKGVHIAIELRTAIKSRIQPEQSKNLSNSIKLNKKLNNANKRFTRKNVKRTSDKPSGNMLPLEQDNNASQEDTTPSVILSIKPGKIEIQAKIVKSE